MASPASWLGAGDGILSLENGDRLTRAEFERIYKQMPHVKSAELIEGVVYVPSPVRLRRHGEPHIHIAGWLFNYRTATPGTLTGDNTTVRLDFDNEPQPDALLLIEPDRGGRARVSADDYIEGAPELVAEVSASSVSIDMNTKLNAYRRNGVREYVVWRVLDRQIDWFVLREGRYEPLAADERGVLRSEVFPGLWLDPAALVAGDLARVVAVLQEGIATPEHAAFVAHLNPPARPG